MNILNRFIFLYNIVVLFAKFKQTDFFSLFSLPNIIMTLNKDRKTNT